MDSFLVALNCDYNLMPSDKPYLSSLAGIPAGTPASTRRGCRDFQPSHLFPGESLTQCPWLQYNEVVQLNHGVKHMGSTPELAHGTRSFEGGRTMQTSYDMGYKPDGVTQTIMPDLTPLSAYPPHLGSDSSWPGYLNISASPSECFDQFSYNMHGFANREQPSWPLTGCPFADVFSVPQSIDIDPGDHRYFCGWVLPDSSTPCGMHLRGDNMKHAISQHLASVHDLSSSKGKSTQQCRWSGCGKELKQESLVRHILTVHLHIEAICKACGSSFARQDSLQRHMKNACGAAKRGH